MTMQMPGAANAHRLMARSAHPVGGSASNAARMVAFVVTVTVEAFALHSPNAALFEARVVSATESLGGAPRGGNSPSLLEG